MPRHIPHTILTTLQRLLRTQPTRQAPLPLSLQMLLTFLKPSNRPRRHSSNIVLNLRLVHTTRQSLLQIILLGQLERASQTRMSVRCIAVLLAPSSSTVAFRLSPLHMALRRNILRTFLVHRFKRLQPKCHLHHPLGPRLRLIRALHHQRLQLSKRP